MSGRIAARAVVVTVQSDAGPVPGYSMLDGPDRGVTFIAWDYRDASVVLGGEVPVTYYPGERFARRAYPHEG